jgi:hypothetical protein
MVCFQIKIPFWVNFGRCWYILLSALWPFVTFCGDLVYFSPFRYIVPRKIWQPCFEGGFASSFVAFVSVQAVCHLADIRDTKILNFV